MNAEPTPIGHAEPLSAMPRAPAGLGSKGAGLWRSVCKAYELEASELVLLEAASRALDDLHRLEKALAAVPTVVTGSHKQAKAHPLFHEGRQARLTLMRLIQALGLTDAESAGADAKSAAGRRMARIRWSGRSG